MIYTTFEQTDYGFVLLDINKKQSDINWFRKNKESQFQELRHPRRGLFGPNLSNLLFLIRFLSDCYLLISNNTNP